MTTTETTTETWRAILARQPALPAPMCGISDHAFRLMCREGAGPFAFTQMVSAEALWRKDKKTVDILDLRGDEPMLGMQLFGSNAERLGAAAAILEEMKPDVIDLNMGCPAKKIVAGQGGSALLRDPKLARDIFIAMRKSITVPFTVKMRWDWDDEGAALEIARIAEGEGVDGLCLHARTREEGYRGHADWTRIAELKRTVSIPVVGNGDVTSPERAVDMMKETGCDGVMIGRGVIGAPWLVAQCVTAIKQAWATGELKGGPAAPETSATPAKETLEQANAIAASTTKASPREGALGTWGGRRAYILRHATLMAEAKGEARGLTLFRKHAVAYIKGLPGARSLRSKLMKVSTIADLDALLPRADEEAWANYGEENRTDKAEAKATG